MTPCLLNRRGVEWFVGSGDAEIRVEAVCEVLRRKEESNHTGETETIRIGITPEQVQQLPGRYSIAMQFSYRITGRSKLLTIRYHSESTETIFSEPKQIARAFHG